MKNKIYNLYGSVCFNRKSMCTQCFSPSCKHTITLLLLLSLQSTAFQFSFNFTDSNTTPRYLSVYINIYSLPEHFFFKFNVGNVEIYCRCGVCRVGIALLSSAFYSHKTVKDISIFYLLQAKIE